LIGIGYVGTVVEAVCPVIPVRVFVLIAGVACPVVVGVFLERIGYKLAVVGCVGLSIVVDVEVAGIAYGVVVGVFLVRVRIDETVVAAVTHTVLIGI